jgi:WD40 repeat protein
MPSSNSKMSNSKLLGISDVSRHIAVYPGDHNAGSSGLIAVSSEYWVYIKNLNTMKTLHVLSTHTYDAAVWGSVFSPDGRRLITFNWETTVTMWCVITGDKLWSIKIDNERAVWCVAFSPSGEKIAIGTGFNTVMVLDVATGGQLQVLEGHTDIVGSVAFSPDGTRLASSSQDNTVRLWDTKSGEQQRVIKGHTAPVFEIAWSPDSESIVSGSADKTVCIWNAESGKQLLEIKGHTNWVKSVAFSTDGKWVASNSYDKTVRVWDAKTGEQLLSETHSAYMDRVFWIPDGTQLMSVSIHSIMSITNIRWRGVVCDLLEQHIITDLADLVKSFL